MKPAPFEYESPRTLRAALDLLAGSDGETKVLAGGQSLVPMMNFRAARPECLVDINLLPELDYIREEGGHVSIGALARHVDVMNSPIVARHFPIVAGAYRWVAHAPIRNRGTLAGNLCHADPASEMPAIMQALDAVLVVESVEGRRLIEARDFFIDVYETALLPSEMLVEIRIPIGRAPTGWGFHEVSMRKGDFAFACVGAVVRKEGPVIADLAVAAAGISSRALRLSALEATLRGQEASAASIDGSLQGGLASVDVIGDDRVPPEYRQALLKTLTQRALLDACGFPSAHSGHEHGSM